MLMKEKIYASVSEKYRSVIPDLEDIQTYLKLHWSLVGLKQAKVLTALKMIYPLIFSSRAWLLLAKEIYYRKSHPPVQYIRKETIPQAELPSELEAFSMAHHCDA
jgi:hypothetical protein